MKRLMLNLMVKKEMAKMACADCCRKLKSERGDTNFISIIIILGIVIVLVGVFIFFREQIVGTIEGVVSGFSKDSLGSSK